MVKKYKKKCSQSLAIKEMQMKTTLRFHLTHIRVAITKITTNNKCWWGCRKKEPSYNTGFPLWKTIWRLLKKLNIDLPYDPAITLLGIYTKECNSGYYKDTCTPMFIAALFTIAKLWKQQDAPLPMNGLKKYDIYIQRNFIQPQKWIKFCHSQVNRWTWRTSS
jgi:hypothetical protein